MLLGVALNLPALLAIGFDPQSSFVGPLDLLVFLYLMTIEGFLLKQCLRLQLWQAVALVAMDVVLSIVLGRLVLVLGDVPIPSAAISS